MFRKAVERHRVQSPGLRTLPSRDGRGASFGTQFGCPANIPDNIRQPPQTDASAARSDNSARDDSFVVVSKGQFLKDSFRAITSAFCRSPDRESCCLKTPPSWGPKLAGPAQGPPTTFRSILNP
jgi:hypothetical protein